MLQHLFCSGSCTRDVETQHEMSTFSGNEFKLFQSPLKAGVGIIWTGSLAYFAELQFQCTVSDMFWFQVRSKTDNLKSFVFHYKLQLGPCTSWKVSEHWIFNQAGSPGTDKGLLSSPPLHCTFAQVISSTSCWLRMKDWFFYGPNIWTQQIFFANLLLQQSVYIFLVHWCKHVSQSIYLFQGFTTWPKKK